MFGNGLRPRCVIHSGEGSLRKDRGGGGGGGGGGVVVVVGEGPAAEMRVAAPFFTGDKNIWRDINLEPPSSLPLLPHHPSSFPANRLPGTPTHPALHSTLLQRPHTHTHALALTALSPLLPSHTLGYTCMRQLSATSCNYTHRSAHTHAVDAVLQEPEMCGHKMQSSAGSTASYVGWLVGWMVVWLVGWDGDWEVE